MSLIRGVLAVAAITIGVAPAAAQTEAAATRAADRGTVRVTPFVSIGSPSSERIGAAVAWPLGPTTSVEAEAGYRSGIVGGPRFSLGLVQDLPQLGRVTPYLAGGIGVEEVTTAASSGSGPVTVARRTAFAINAGGGVRVPVVKDWDVRTDARWVNALGQQGERWRVYNGLSIGMPRR